MLFKVAMAKKRTFTFVLPTGLQSLITLLVLGILSVARAELLGLLGNSLRGPGEIPKRRPRIINGDDVKDKRYPYFSLMFGQGMCGGVLIAPRLVLSAAHCEGAADLFRIGGFKNIGDGQHVTIRNAIIHEDYDKSRFDYDIMIFELDEEANVPYITLEKDEVKKGDFTVLGFGDTDKGYPLELADNLQEVELEYVDNDTCDEGHGDRGEVTEDMMCAAGKDKDSCIGDSGGPLIRKGDSIEGDRLVGLVSWGRECAEDGVPGVYVRISFFYDWIVKKVCETYPDDSPPYMGCNPKSNPKTTPDPTAYPTPNPFADWFIVARSREPTNKPTNPTTREPTRSPVPTSSLRPSATPTSSPLPSVAPVKEVVLVGWTASGLRECEGDCDKDDDCQGDLVCFQRNLNTDVSVGCSGYENVPKSLDVCIRPKFLP